MRNMQFLIIPLLYIQQIRKWLDELQGWSFYSSRPMGNASYI